MMIDLFLPKNWQNSEKNIITYKHSLTVANASKKIASKTSSILDPEKAYIYGLMHDIGKFFLDHNKKEMYKHPRIGYEILKDLSYIDIAEICISHAFPNFDKKDHILRYCNNDVIESEKVFNILKYIKNNDYIELVQICDKISTIDSYVTIEDKLKWYLEKNRIEQNELVNCYINKLNQIKSKFDSLTNCNIYDLVNAT